MNFKKIYKKPQKKLKKIEAEKKEKYRTKRIKMWTTLYLSIYVYLKKENWKIKKKQIQMMTKIKKQTKL